MCSTPPAMATSIGAETDRGGHGRDGGHRTGAHAVDRVARGGLGQAREQQARRPRVRPWSPIWVVAAIGDLFDPLLGQFGVARSSSRMHRMTRSSARVWA
jgi:hypothetical protein